MPRRPPTSTGRTPGRQTLDPSVECVPARRSGRLALALPPSPATDQSKLAVPPPPEGVLRRPRIDALLDAAPGPLRVVSAPAGYGRTTALAAWARAADRRCAWLSLDERDDDPEHLRAHLRAALDGLPPAAPGTLVVDDAHRVTAPESTELLRAIATAPPHGVRVVVAARITADGWPDRLGAPTVDADALAFTAEESTAVLESAWGPGTDHRRLAQAHRTTGGWPAAVGLVTDAVAGAPGWRTFSESLDAAAVAIARRVASDVLAGTDEDLRRFLLRTATLRRPDEDACAAVTAEPGAGELLRRARRSGVLTTGAGGAPVHRGPFRVALRRLLEELEPALVPTLHRRASAWSAACGDLGTAAEHATAAGDVLRAVAIADAHVAHRGALPGPGAADAPRGVAPPASASAWPADVAAARRQLDDHPEADATVRGAASAALALALWRTGDDEAVRAHLEPRIGATVDPATRCWSLALLALAVAPRDPQRAEALARHARRISRRPGATWLEPVLAHQALADALRARGDLGAAHVALGEAAVRTGAVPGSGHHGLTLLLRAELAIAAGDPAAARRVLRDGDPVGVPAGRVAATRAAAA